MRAITAAALATALLGYAGSISAQVLDDLSPAAIRQQVTPGDAVRASVQDGRSFELTVLELGAETLTGTTAEQRRFRIRYSALASLEITRKAAPPGSGAVPPAPAADNDEGRVWLGLNLGLVTGSVDVPCGNPSDSDCSEGGIFTSFGTNLTYAGPVALRLRAVRANEDTDHPPVEFAALVGPRVTDGVYALIGVSNVTHPDDELDGDATGVAWELVFAPRSQSGTGVELMLHGAVGSDLDYTGASLGFRFGN